MLVVVQVLVRDKGVRGGFGVGVGGSVEFGVGARGGFGVLECVAAEAQQGFRRTQ